jgi:hypothetical protein
MPGSRVRFPPFPPILLSTCEGPPARTIDSAGDLRETRSQAFRGVCNKALDIRRRVVRRDVVGLVPKQRLTILDDTPPPRAVGSQMCASDRARKCAETHPGTSGPIPLGTALPRVGVPPSCPSCSSSTEDAAAASPQRGLFWGLSARPRMHAKPPRRSRSLTFPRQHTCAKLISNRKDQLMQGCRLVLSTVGAARWVKLRSPERGVHHDR